MKRARDPAAIRNAMATRTGLSLREAALLTGCAKGTISNVLKGDRVSPDLARCLAAVLQRPVAVLFQDADANDEPSNDQQDAVA